MYIMFGTKNNLFKIPRKLFQLNNFALIYRHNIKNESLLKIVCTEDQLKTNSN